MPPMPWHGVVTANEVPLVRVEPDYPRRQQTAGVEGWVQLRFTILGSGAVTDVIVVDAYPKGVFDDAAIKAVRRWKYSPRIDEGRAVEMRGVGVVVKFNLNSP
jgi:protein TonB